MGIIFIYTLVTFPMQAMLLLDFPCKHGSFLDFWSILFPAGKEPSK
jgi:hypothetical protein